MALVLAKTNEMSHEQWLEMRKQFIGGSEAASILGRNPYSSKYDVYLQKTGEAEPLEQNEAMYFGTILEDVVAKEFQTRTGKKVRRRNAILTHPKYPFMGANLDREIVGEKALLECKTASEYKSGDWENGVPDHYYYQVQHYLAVTGYEKAYIAALVGGNKFYIREIERNDLAIDILIEEEKNFWENHVIPKIPPEVDSKTDLDQMYPEAKGTQIELPLNAIQLIEEYKKLQTQEDTVKEQKDLISNKIKALLGENDCGICGDYKVTWKNVSSNRFDSKSFQKENKELYEKYMKQSSYRRFQIS